MINSPTVRLIIIGAGKMGLAHSQAFKKTDGVDIVAITSRTLESAKRLADKFGVQIFGTEWKLEAIRSKATAAIIAVPHLLTEQLTSEVLEYGLHILVEKPVSLNSTTIKALGSMARKKGVIAMVAMNRRFYSTVIDGILITKFYGDVLGLTVIAPDPVSSYRAEAKYDKKVYDEWFKMNTIHIVDLMRLVGGDVTDVKCLLTKRGRESSRVGLLKFKSGIAGSFTSVNSIGGMNHWELIIHGEGVEVRLKPLERGVVTNSTGSIRILGSSDKDVKKGLLSQANFFIRSIILGKVCYPGSDFDDHASTLDLAEHLDIG